MIKKIKKPFIILISLLSIFIIFNGQTCEQENAIKYIVGDDPASAGTETVKRATSNIAGVLAAAASTIALIFIIVGGIQYITSGGNQEQAQKAKSTLTWAIVGFILVIASYGIVIYFLNFLETGKTP